MPQYQLSVKKRSIVRKIVITESGENLKAHVSEFANTNSVPASWVEVTDMSKPKRSSKGKPKAKKKK